MNARKGITPTGVTQMKGAYENEKYICEEMLTDGGESPRLQMALK